MPVQFLRVGEHVINFANVTHITRQGPKGSSLFQVHFVGTEETLTFSATGPDGRALFNWLSNSVPALTDGTEEIPFAVSRG